MGKGYSFYFLAPCIVTIGFLISLIGVTSSDWIHLRNEDGVTVYENIWKYCWNDASTNDCTYFKIGQSRTIDSVRALMIISLLFYVLTCVLALFAYLYDGRGVMYSAGAAVSSLMEALLMMIGLVVYTVRAENQYPQLHYNWGYSTCWAAFAVLLIAVGSFCFQAISLNKKRETYIPVN